MESTKELNMDEKVTVINLAPWNVGFNNATTPGASSFAPKAKVRIKRDEIVYQVGAGNKLLAGLDSYGSHATLYIDDEATRKYLEFDSQDGKRKQNVMSDERIMKWFELKTQNAFEKNIKENVVTMAEKSYVLDAIKRLHLDSHEKITFCQEYCKFRLF